MNILKYGEDEKNLTVGKEYSIKGNWFLDDIGTIRVYYPEYFEVTDSVEVTKNSAYTLQIGKTKLNLSEEQLLELKSKLGEI